MEKVELVRRLEGSGLEFRGEMSVRGGAVNRRLQPS